MNCMCMLIHFDFLCEFRWMPSYRERRVYSRDVLSVSVVKRVFEQRMKEKRKSQHFFLFNKFDVVFLMQKKSLFKKNHNIKRRSCFVLRVMKCF